MTAQYFVHANLQPSTQNGTDEQAFIKAYMEEYIPKVLKSKAATRIALYRENFEHPLASKDQSARQYLVLAQTEHAEMLKCKEYLSIPGIGSYFSPDAETASAKEQFDVRNYSVIQNYDPQKLEESIAPTLLTAEVHPADDDDLERWYREEHLDMLAEIPGYKRSVRGVIGPRTNLTLGTPPKFIAMHFFNELSGFNTDVGKGVSETPWTQKIWSTSSMFVLRGWDLLHSEGFVGSS